MVRKAAASGLVQKNCKRLDWHPLWDRQLLQDERFMRGRRAPKGSYAGVAKFIYEVAGITPNTRQVENRIALLRKARKLFLALAERQRLGELLQLERGKRPSVEVLAVGGAVGLDPGATLRAANLVRRRRRIFLGALGDEAEEELEYFMQEFGVADGSYDDTDNEAGDSEDEDDSASFETRASTGLSGLVREEPPASLRRRSRAAQAAVYVGRAEEEYEVEGHEEDDDDDGEGETEDELESETREDQGSPDFSNEDTDRDSGAVRRSQRVRVTRSHQVAGRHSTRTGRSR